MTRFGKIEVTETHNYSSPVHGFRISPVLQSLLTALGADETYSGGNKLIMSILNIDINQMQLHRVTNVHGKAMLNGISENEAEVLKSSLKADDITYVMIDGAMIFTREEAWKEVKTARIFAASAELELSASRREIAQSLYVSHLGGKDDFLEKIEPLIDVFEPLGARLAFVTDGALWIGNWIQSEYPKATVILDIYHALEHLNNWSG